MLGKRKLLNRIFLFSESHATESGFMRCERQVERTQHCTIFVYSHLYKSIPLIRIRSILVIRLRSIDTVTRTFVGHSRLVLRVILRFIQLPEDYRIEVLELRVEPT